MRETAFSIGLQDIHKDDVGHVKDITCSTLETVAKYVCLYVVVSCSTIVLYSTDHKGVGVAHKRISPKTQPQFPLMMMRQYWLGKTKHKKAIRSTRNASNKLLRNFKNNLFNGIFY